MGRAMGRLTVSIPTDVKSEIDAVKQQEFHDKPYAELYRHIIRLGLAKMREKTGNEKQHNPTKQLEESTWKAMNYGKARKKNSETP